MECFKENEVNFTNLLICSVKSHKSVNLFCQEPWLLVLFIAFEHKEPTQSVCVADCYFIVNVLDLPFASPIAIYR